jgi:hypothetical protein
MHNGHFEFVSNLRSSHPPTKNIPFKIPMKIVECVLNNCYFGDGTIHPGDHLLFIHELCELFKCAGISMDQVKRKLFSYH